MDLFLRKVIQPQTRDSYRVVIKDDGDEIEICSIGIQLGVGTAAGWVWGIDFVIPMRHAEVEGVGKNRQDCMKKFRAAWERFGADPAQLTEFLAMKRKGLR